VYAGKPEKKDDFIVQKQDGLVFHLTPDFKEACLKIRLRFYFFGAVIINWIR